MAIAALSASLFNGVDPVQCLIRGVIAWFAGLTAGSMWNLFFSRPNPVRLRVLTEPSAELEPETDEEPESKLAA